MGLIQKVDEGIEDDTIGGPSDVKKLRRPNLPSAIWEVLETYSDLFPSELPKGIPPIRVGHEFKIDLEDETPPIHRPLCKLLNLRPLLRTTLGQAIDLPVYSCVKNARSCTLSLGHTDSQHEWFYSHSGQQHVLQFDHSYTNTINVIIQCH